MKTLVDNSHKALKDIQKEFADIDEILNIVIELKFLIEEDNYKNDSIKKI